MGSPRHSRDRVGKGLGFKLRAAMEVARFSTKKVLVLGIMFRGPCGSHTKSVGSSSMRHFPTQETK